MNSLRSITSVTLLLIAALAGAGETALPYYGSADFTPHWLEPDADELRGMHRIPDFSFVNQDGDVVTEADVAGGVYVANFFFTSCPGICPAIRKKLVLVQERFADDDYVKILTHTIQPTTDTVDMLDAYARANAIQSGKWHLLTGDKDTIYRLASEVYFANEDQGEVTGKDKFLHTENLLLIDANRHIRGVYNGLSASAVANLIADIELLKSEADRRESTVVEQSR